MAMLVSGADKNLLGIVDACFHEMNHVDEQADAAQTSLYEVCNLCYSLKVLIR